MDCIACTLEFDPNQEITLNRRAPYFEVSVNCPHCGAEHYTSFTAKDLICAEKPGSRKPKQKGGKRKP